KLEEATEKLRYESIGLVTEFEKQQARAQEIEDDGVNETIVDDDMAEVGVNEDVMHEGFNLGVNKMLWMKEMT
ncbi:hypothetical protein RYX36_027133, partial [Vicia faba]